jgi:guanine deaminase
MELKFKDSQYLKLAIQTATENIHKGGGPFGAVIVMQGRVVSCAGNMVVKENDPTAHAEMRAIRMAAAALGTHDLSKCIMYASCEPCPMCLGAIYWAGIKRVVYASDRHSAAAAGFDDAKIYSEIETDNSEKSIIMVHGLEEEGDRVFGEWNNFPGKVLY